MTKAIIYYTDNTVDETLRQAVAKQLIKSAKGIPIISVSWKPIKLGRNIVVEETERSDKTIYKQIVTGLNNTKADIIYLAECDVLYHPSHFGFIPPRKDTLYFNENKWRIRTSDGKTAFRRLKRGKAYGRSQMVGYREIILSNYTIKTCNQRKKFISKCPNIDIRHKYNLTTPNIFNNNSVIADGVPFWNKDKINNIVISTKNK